MANVRAARTTNAPAAQSAGDLFGVALDALLADTVSPEILHQLIDLAVALRDHERSRQNRGDDG